MKKVLFLLMIIILCSSCSTMSRLIGKEYVYESPNRKLIFSFDNDSICTLTNIFICDDMDSQYKKIVSKAYYKKESDKILLRNIDCKDNCNLPPIVDIPIQTNSKCKFLNAESRVSKTLFDGRTYQSEYLKNGAVPNIDIDTLFIYKRQLTLIKKLDRGSIGFIFK